MVTTVTREQVLPKGNLKRIHVNQHIIKSNKKNDEVEPTFTIKFGGDVYRGNQVDIRGLSHVVYRPRRPLSCGAHCWIETRAEVAVLPDHAE